ncbi:MAG: GtrA family protein [Anaerolineales bacterium]|nr:GtrA family protein [Anaerolineales bacterium]
MTNTMAHDSHLSPQPKQGGFLTRLNDRDGYIRKFSRRIGGVWAADIERFIKFLFVGALGAVIDLGLTNLLMIIFHVQDGETNKVLLASSVGFTVAVCSNFFWNRYWTYPDSRSRAIVHQLVMFFILSVIGLAIRAFIVANLTVPFANAVTNFSHSMKWAIEDKTLFKIGANGAVMLSLVIVAAWNFAANRKITYSDVDKVNTTTDTP